ncbi:MAG: acyltransferase [Candidatus Latescibacterota bacterium]
MSGSTFLPHDWFDRPLPDNVFLGKGAWLYSAFAFRHYRSTRPVGMRAGRHTGLYDGTFFDLGPGGEVVIGDYCTVVGAIFCTDRRIVVGDHVLMAHEVVLADAAVGVPPGPAGAPAPSVANPLACEPLAIVVEDGAWIAAGAVLLAGARIGRDAIVGAGAVVDFAVPALGLVAGNPARLVRTASPSPAHQS